jgi:hypothetical protein
MTPTKENEMPQNTTNLTVGQRITKLWNDAEWIVEIESVNPIRVTVYKNTIVRIGTYASMTAAAQAVRGNDGAVNGWSFFGLRNPNARTVTRRVTRDDGTTEEVVVELPKGKCKHEGCYEPAACKHGFCSDHCQRHSIGMYSTHTTPRNNKPHVGVEIEVLYASHDDFRRGIGLDNAHADGSLGGMGAEYKLLAESTKIAAEAANLVKELWTRRARVDRTCGLHVHLDVRQISTTRKNDLYDWAKRTQDVWFSLVPPSRRHNCYVSRIEGSHSSHYTWFHYTSYGTAEIRLHGGTLNPFKMAGWLTAMVHLQAKAHDATYTFPNTGDAEADFWTVFADCKAEGKEYLAARKAHNGRLRDKAFSAVEE